MNVHSIHAVLRPSRTLRLVSTFGHGLALIALLPMAWQQPLWFVVMALVLAHGVERDRYMAHHPPGGWQRLIWASDDRIQWRDDHGRERAGPCLAAGQWGAVWVRLTVRPDGSRWQRRVLIPRDATQGDAHRRMRVRIRVAPRGRHRDDSLS